MRLLIFTLLLSFLSVSSFSAVQEWNVSSDDFNSLGDITETTTINGLTIYATDAKKVTVQENGKEINGMTFTYRMKLNGGGEITAGEEYRAVGFDVTGNSTISIVAISSNGSESRQMAVVAGTDTIDIITVAGDAVSWNDINYVGDATTIKVFSMSSGLNLYYIKAEDATDTTDSTGTTGTTDEYAIFDPATVDTSTLADGMSIVEIDGKKMLQVVVDGWNSIVDVPAFTFEPGMRAYAEFKYTIGQTDFAAEKINATVQLIDSVNLMDVSWSADQVHSTTSLVQSNPSGEFVKTWADAVPTFKVVHQVQFFGQQTVSWGAVVGDTLWVGKIRAYKYDENTVFDPETQDPDDLKDGMEIVEMDGKKMLQVVVDGWNSIVDVPAFTFEPGMRAYADFKYTIGQTDFTAEQINATVQLIDSVNLMDVSWSADQVHSTTSLVQSNPSGEFVKTWADAVPTFKVVHQVQFFGQQTVSWGAVVGDTLWVGKVRAYKYEENTIFDPATQDPDDFKDGMELVDIDGTKYLKVVVDGWNSILDVPEFTIPANVKAMCNFKYVVGQNEFAASQINADVQLIDTVNLMAVSWSADSVSSTTGIVQSNPSGEFAETSADITETMKVVHQVQFFGQQTASWGAVVGDTMWVGKVTVKDATPPDPNTIIDPATFIGDLGTGWEIVEIDGEKYFKVALDAWSSWMNVPEYTFPEGKNAFRAEVKYEAGTSGASLDGLKTFLKFSDAGWTEIGAGSASASTDFKDYVVTLAANEGNVAGVFQVAVQDANNGYSAISGDFLYIGKIMAVTTAPITFQVDDSKYKMYDGFSLKGSWLTESGIYDKDWNGGALHAEFTDSVLVDADNDVWETDNIWEYTTNLVADDNTWEWGFVELDNPDNWLVTGDNPQFSVPDWTPQTITYTIGGTGVDNWASDLKVYPNPADGFLNVVGHNIESIAIYNLSGAQVISNQMGSTRLNVSGLAKGSYIIKVVANNGESAISKFTKR